MELIKTSVKKLSKEEQKKIVGGWNEYCENNIQGNGSNTCKTDARCDLDVPVCEAI